MTDRPSPSQLVLNLISTMKLLPRCHVKEIPALILLEMILLFICFILTALSNKLRYYEMKETLELLTVQRHTRVSVLLSLKINILRAEETVLGWRHMPYIHWPQFNLWHHIDTSTTRWTWTILGSILSFNHARNSLSSTQGSWLNSDFLF